MKIKKVESTFDRETDLVIAIVRHNNEMRDAERRAKLETDMQCEAEKYRRHLKQIRHAYHSISQILWVLCGSTATLAVIQTLLGGGPMCLLATVFTFISMFAAMSCDKRSRHKKGKES